MLAINHLQTLLPFQVVECSLKWKYKILKTNLILSKAMLVSLLSPVLVFLRAHKVSPPVGNELKKYPLISSRTLDVSLFCRLCALR